MFFCRPTYIILTKNEPFLFHFPENPGSRHGHLPACSSLCASQKQTPRRIGAAALHRRRNRRSRHRIRPRPGIPPAQHLLLPWHSLRRRHRRRKPLHAAATAARMAGNPACGSFRGLITSTLLRPAARILLDVCRPLELRPDGRRLPAAQHLDAGPCRRQTPSGTGMAPRRGFHGG